MNRTIQFHLPWRIAFSSLFILMWLPPIITAHGLTPKIAVIILLGLIPPMFVIWFLSVVSISADGIVLYRMNKLDWSDIKSARPRKFLGIRHIYIQRNKGTSWWLPLYFRGPCAIKTALLQSVPEDNVLHQLAETL